METVRKFTQPVAMRVTKNQYESDLALWADEIYIEFSVDYRPKRFHFYEFLAAHQSKEMLSLTHKYLLLNKTYIIEDYNPDLFLAIAAMSEGGFWPGEWVVALSTQKSVPFGKGEILKVLSSVNGVVKLHGEDYESSSYSGHFFRKATVEELVNHFTKRKQEATLAWEPAFGDHVQGKFANGKCCLGTYIEESTIGSWHYVKDKHSEETHQCVSIEPIPKITIELSALVRMYAEKIDADPDQIKIDFDK